MSDDELLITGGTLIDGSGAAGRPADLLLRAGRIAAILDPGRVAPGQGGRATLDATGLLVAPGFIDIHSHSDFTLLADPRAVSAISQGVTTEVIGNCGFGCAPIGGPAPAALNVYGHRSQPAMDWRGTAGYFARLEAAGPAVNVAALVPNGKLRLATVGTEERPARPDELRAMRYHLDEGLEAGAFGLSTGLEYGPERGCAEHELITLCQQVARVGGIYATHTRNEQGQAMARGHAWSRIVVVQLKGRSSRWRQPGSGASMLATICRHASLAPRTSVQPCQPGPLPVAQQSSVQP